MGSCSFEGSLSTSVNNEQPGVDLLDINVSVLGTVCTAFAHHSLPHFVSNVGPPMVSDKITA